MKQISITEEQAREMVKSGIPSLKSIAVSNFPNLFHQEKKWEDFGITKGYYIDDNSIIFYRNSGAVIENRNTFPTENEARASLIRSQLYQWRDKSNEQKLNEWADWLDGNQEKYTITNNQGMIFKTYSHTHFSPLAFKTEEIRNQFIKDHNSLIKKLFQLEINL